MDQLIRIIHSTGMSNRPGYYSGRGATLTDLNGDKLTKIHAGIKKEFGEEAAKSFVLMVADIKVLSATTFLVELYNLYNADWKYVKKKVHASGLEIEKDENGQHNMLQGFASIFASLGNDRDDTYEIRHSFLRSNGMRVKNPNARYYNDLVSGRKMRRERDSHGNYRDYVEYE